MNIYFYSTQPHEPALYQSLNQKNHQLSFLDYHLNEITVASLPLCDVVSCFVNDSINQAVIDVLAQRGVKLIALRSAGFNHVDYQYAKQKGIAVCRVPEYSPEAIAEHAMALILCLNRKIHRAYNRVREGNFSLNGLLGFNLHQKTVGIIGTGKIGTAFAKILTGFGCNILASDPLTNQACIALGVKYVDINTLLKESDIISLHCPLNPDTKHMINEQRLSKMKSGVMLINTGRGALIDTKAVINALKSKKIGYLGIDVYEEEGPLFFEDHALDIITDDLFCRLLTFPNVIITGHQGFFTEEAVHNIANVTMANINHFFDGAAPLFLIGCSNPA